MWAEGGPKRTQKKTVQHAVTSVLQQHTANIGLESDSFQMEDTSLTTMKLVSTLRKLEDSSLRMTDIYDRPVLWQPAEVMSMN